MPIINIIKSDPYELDLREVVYRNKTYTIAALTKKNSQFLEAVVKIDSNYKRDMRDVPPDRGFNVEENASLSNGKYCGSLTHWFLEMQKPGADYRKCVLGAVISIDRGNSTHLEQVEGGRKIMRDRIVECCPNVETLKNALEKEFNPSDETHLISKMTKSGMKGIKDGNDRFFISFASKFCAYAATVLRTNNQYSKYDNVVSDYLNLYAIGFCDRTYAKSAFKIEQIKGDFETKRIEGLKTYHLYQKVIDQIITSQELGFELSKSEFDHIVWYFEKGK